MGELLLDLDVPLDGALVFVAGLGDVSATGGEPRAGGDYGDGEVAFEAGDGQERILGGTGPEAADIGVGELTGDAGGPGPGGAFDVVLDPLAAGGDGVKEHADAAVDDGFGVGLVGEAETWADVVADGGTDFLAGREGDVVVEGNGGDAAGDAGIGEGGGAGGHAGGGDDVVCVGDVEAVGEAVVEHADAGEVLVADAEVEGEIGSGLPGVGDVSGPELHVEVVLGEVRLLRGEGGGIAEESGDQRVAGVGRVDVAGDGVGEGELLVEISLEAVLIDIVDAGLEGMATEEVGDAAASVDDGIASVEVGFAAAVAGAVGAARLMYMPPYWSTFWKPALVAPVKPMGEKAWVKT